MRQFVIACAAIAVGALAALPAGCGRSPPADGSRVGDTAAQFRDGKRLSEKAVRLPGPEGIVAPERAATADYEPVEWPDSFRPLLEITIEAPELPDGIEGPTPPLDE